MVLQEYTDDFIDRSVEGRDDRWAQGRRQLRTVPAEWRQSVWAASFAKAYRLQVLLPPLGRGLDLELTHVPTGVDPDEALIETIAEFHAGHRPRRMESVA